MAEFNDNLGLLRDKFFDKRQENLFNRFPGLYRALVVETNDPLQMYRVKFKCPELHNFDLRVEDCPWAVPAPCLGGKNAGTWFHPIIGDIIWISWEKNHPYGPVWVGFADETRRRRYPLESIYVESPSYVDNKGSVLGTPNDWQVDGDNYLPKDRRPMSTGEHDRYGSIDVNRSYGFFPIEHNVKPALPGIDGVNQTDFELNGSKPQINNPDMKYSIKMSKYGNYMILSDVGYLWRKKDESENDWDYGEFVGDFDQDIGFEESRFKYYTKHFNEQEPNSADRDQRRIEFRTRAGHFLEMRDVGWAQEGGGRAGKEDVGQAKCRPEFGDKRVLSKWTETDERWMKIRTKGGHIIQMMDTGFHPEEDEFYKREIKEEVGSNDTFDHEKQDEWTERDARQMRFVTRHGFKFVLDDRGSDPKDAEGNGELKGNGFLLKTRRDWKPQGTEYKGYGIEVNDKPKLNRMICYSPKSKVMEMNDEYDYTMVCSDTEQSISEDWQKLKENEFVRKVSMTVNPEKNTYHMKLDRHNGYMRLKTAAGYDNDFIRGEPNNYSSADKADSETLQQGLEARDGRYPARSVWVELVDMQDRGLFITKNHNGAQGLSILRSAGEEHRMFLAISEISPLKDHIVISNDGERIHIWCKKDVTIHAGNDMELYAENNIRMHAGNRIEISANNDINLTSEKTQVTMWAKNNVVANVNNLNDWYLNSSEFRTFKKSWSERAEALDMYANTFHGALVGGGGSQPPYDNAPNTPPKPPIKIDVNPKKPNDRAKAEPPTDNVTEVDIELIKDKSE